MNTIEKMENNVFIKVESFNNINSKIVKQNINLKCLTETDSIGMQHIIKYVIWQSSELKIGNKIHFSWFLEAQIMQYQCLNTSLLITSTDTNYSAETTPPSQDSNTPISNVIVVVTCPLLDFTLWNKCKPLTCYLTNQLYIHVMLNTQIL